jgi:hypothetical protein
MGLLTSVIKGVLTNQGFANTVMAQPAPWSCRPRRSRLSRVVSAAYF